MRRSRAQKTARHAASSHLQRQRRSRQSDAEPRGAVSRDAHRVVAPAVPRDLARSRSRSPGRRCTGSPPAHRRPARRRHAPPPARGLVSPTSSQPQHPQQPGSFLRASILGSASGSSHRLATPIQRAISACNPGASAQVWKVWRWFTMSRITARISSSLKRATSDHGMRSPSPSTTKTSSGPVRPW